MAIQEPIARPLTARDPRLAPWRSFLLAHARVSRRLDEELRAEHDVSFAEYDALLTIAQAPGRRIRMGLLAEEVLLSKSGVTRLVDRLVNDGLVERSACSTDARGAEAVLTDRGPRAPPGRLADAPARHQRALPGGRRDRRSRAARARDDERRPTGRAGSRRTRVLCARRPRHRRTRASPADRSGAGPPVRGDERVRLPGLGAALLPGRAEREGLPRPLRRAFARRRAEQHLLRVAEGAQGRGVGRGHTARFPLLGQGPAGRLVPVARRRSRRERGLADRPVPCLRGAARDRPLPRPRERPARRCEARGAAGRMARRPAPHDGVPGSVVARRRDVRGAGRGRRRAVRHRAPGGCRAADAAPDRARSSISACDGTTTATRTSRPGPRDRAVPVGR